MTTVQFLQKILNLQDNMFHFALQLTANREDAKDLLQETTLRALCNRSKFVDDANFKGWVLTIMRNIFINDCRKAVNSQTVFDITDDLYYLNLPQDLSHNNSESDLSVQDITKAINSLDTRMKNVFSLLVEGYKYDEIAQKLDLPLGTVKNRIFLAKKILQARLKEMI
ncbi:MAG: RNA polymerase sigma factor [Dysgonamonadaceae bacterium]|jgi:RNA polymerase sigma-70 factor (ECF subfamily)|nr:RNA polymerase sigma factor [Dysgonamonadaceae bacterium]